MTLVGNVNNFNSKKHQVLNLKCPSKQFCVVFCVDLQSRPYVFASFSSLISWLLKLVKTNGPSCRWGMICSHLSSWIFITFYEWRPEGDTREPTLHIVRGRAKTSESCKSSIFDWWAEGSCYFGLSLSTSVSLECSSNVEHTILI